MDVLQRLPIGRHRESSRRWLLEGTLHGILYLLVSGHTGFQAVSGRGACYTRAEQCSGKNYCRFSRASCAAVYAFMSNIFQFALTLTKMGNRTSTAKVLMRDTNERPQALTRRPESPVWWNTQSQSVDD